MKYVEFLISLHMNDYEPMAPNAIILALLSRKLFMAVVAKLRNVIVDSDTHFKAN